MAVILRLSTLFVRTLREDPVDAEVTSHKLLVRAGYIRRAAPGIYTWLPLGLRVLRKVKGIIREEMDAIGSQEVHFPALLPKEPYEASGRWDDYGEGIFRLQDRKDADYLLAPTHEEVFTLLVKDLYTSYKDLPLSLYQIQTKYRDEARPRAGLLRGREFIMKDSYSFDFDEVGLEASYQAHRGAYFRIFERLGLDVLAVQATAGAMGGSKSEEFLHPCDIGEDTFVRSPGGYVANVEALTTPVPDPVDYAHAPAAQVVDTGESATIDTLVDAINQIVPRSDRPWTAADTLKNVLIAVTSPRGQRKIVAIGVPGDRAIDVKRLEAHIGPHCGFAGEVTVTAATDADLAEHPEVVKGYIGPGAQAGCDRPILGKESATGLLYLVDLRVAPGTAWVTGANQRHCHVIHAVAGRDFNWDGTVEAVEVRSGDLAPDGSGEIEIVRGMEMGHVFQLGRRYAQALGLKVLDQQGRQVVVTMGSYGIGVTRAVAAIVEKNHDERGIMWPTAVAPVQVHILSVSKEAPLLQAAEDLAQHLCDAGLDVLIDDRAKVSPGVKFADAELLGAPVVIAVGRGLAEGTVEVKNRRTGEACQVPIEGVSEWVDRWVGA